MRLSLRFVLPLILVLAGIAYGVAPLVDRLTLSWFVRDLDIRSSLIADTIQEPLQEQLTAGRRVKIIDFFNRMSRDERIFAVGYCAKPTGTALASRAFPAELRCAELGPWEESRDHLLRRAEGPLHVAVKPMASEAAPAGRLILVHDMSFITRRSEETKRYVFYFFMGLAAVVSLVTVIIAQFSWRDWMAGMRSLLRGEGLLWQPGAGAEPTLPGFKPIARDLQRLVRELESDARAASPASRPSGVHRAADARIRCRGSGRASPVRWGAVRANRPCRRAAAAPRRGAGRGFPESSRASSTERSLP